jgi:hypothetical protein
VCRQYCSRIRPGLKELKTRADLLYYEKPTGRLEHELILDRSEGASVRVIRFTPFALKAETLAATVKKPSFRQNWQSQLHSYLGVSCHHRIFDVQHAYTIFPVISTNQPTHSIEACISGSSRYE